MAVVIAVDILVLYDLNAQRFIKIANLNLVYVRCHKLLRIKTLGGKG